MPVKQKKKKRRLRPLTDAQKKLAERICFAMFTVFFISASVIVTKLTAPVSVSSTGGNIAATVMAASEHGQEHNDTLEEPPLPEPEDNTITFSFVGDCMLATMLGSDAQNTFNHLADTVEPTYFFAGCTDYFLTDDFTVANCENVFTDDTSLQPTYKNYSPAYWYRSKKANAGIFKQGGVDIVSIANNHAADYGQQGYTDTVAALEENGVLWGDNNKTVVVEKCGKKIALLLVTMYYSGAESAIIRQMNEVRDEVDFVIVYYHGGTERVYQPDKWRVNGAHNLIDAGADLVIGGHPHVLQPIEEYNGKYIIHSLGNFLFGGSTRPENRTVIFRYIITVNEDGTVTDAIDVIPYYCYIEPWQPAEITDEAQRNKVVDFLWGREESPI